MRTIGCFLLAAIAVLVISCKSAEVNRRAEPACVKYMTLAGRVVMPDGQPVAEAEIHIRFTYISGTHRFGATTNQNGEYTCRIHYFDTARYAMAIIVKKAGTSFSAASSLNEFRETIIFRPSFPFSQ